MNGRINGAVGKVLQTFRESVGISPVFPVEQVSPEFSDYVIDNRWRVFVAVNGGYRRIRGSDANDLRESYLRSLLSGNREKPQNTSYQV